MWRQEHTVRRNFYTLRFRRFVRNSDCIRVFVSVGRCRRVRRNGEVKNGNRQLGVWFHFDTKSKRNAKRVPSRCLSRSNFRRFDPESGELRFQNKFPTLQTCVSLWTAAEVLRWIHGQYRNECDTFERTFVVRE